MNNDPTMWQRLASRSVAVERSAHRTGQSRPEHPLRTVRVRFADGPPTGRTAGRSSIVTTHRCPAPCVCCR